MAVAYVRGGTFGSAASGSGGDWDSTINISGGNYLVVNISWYTNVTGDFDDVRIDPAGSPEVATQITSTDNGEDAHEMWGLLTTTGSSSITLRCSSSNNDDLEEGPAICWRLYSGVGGTTNTDAFKATATTNSGVTQTSASMATDDGGMGVSGCYSFETTGNVNPGTGETERFDVGYLGTSDTCLVGTADIATDGTSTTMEWQSLSGGSCGFGTLKLGTSDVDISVPLETLTLSSANPTVGRSPEFDLTNYRFRNDDGDLGTPP
jgi:hypothetical protein